MASSWSRSLGIGNYGSQMRVTVQVLSQNRSANTSRVKVKIEAYNGGASRAYNQGSGATVSVSGNGISHSAQVTFSIGGRSWFTFADWDFTVSHNANGTLPVNIVGRIADTGTSSLGNGGGVRVQGTADPLYLAPTTPSWGSTAYQNASSVRIGWTNRSSARGAYTNVRVQRWLRSTGTWTNRALLSGGSSSYTDTSIPGNNEVRWRVRAEGPGGNSGWSTGGTLGTVPAGASNVQAVKSGQGVRVTWKDNAGPTNRTRTFFIDDNPGGTGWVRVGSIGGSATSWTHSDADPSVTHQYRIWTRITSGIDLTATGTGGPSNVVQLQAAPKQPGRVGPLDVVPLEVGDTLELEWSHNPVDTTEQTEAEVQWRLDGGAWTTSKVTGSSNTLEVTPSTSQARVKFEWRVRTKGAHPNWSPWSTTNGPLLSTRPQVVVQSPESGEPLTVSRVLATWAYEPGGDQSQLQQAEWSAVLSLYASGTPIENAAGTTETEVQLDTRLENRTEYALVVSVRNGDGLWSQPETSVFPTNFPLPAVVEAYPEWDQASGAVSVGFGESEEPRATYRWTGGPYASPSEAVDQDGEVIARNEVPNPLGPGVNSTDGWRLTAGGPFEIVEDEGRPVAKFTQGESGTSFYLDPAPNFRPPVGAVFRFAVDVKVLVPFDRTRLRLGVYNGASVSYAGGGVPGYVSQVPEDGWVRHSIEAEVDAMPEGGYVRALLWPDGVEAGSAILVRDAVVTYDAPEGVDYFDGDSTGTTDVDAIDVERRQPDGSWLLVASGIPTSTTVVDRTPQIGDVEYRAVSRTVLPTERTGPSSTAVWVHDKDPVFVNGGEGMGQLCLARGSEATDEHEVDQALHRFAGQDRPTAFFGAGQDHTTSFTGKILPHYYLPTSTRQEWVELLRQRGLVCFRDCTGRKVFGVLSVSFSQTGNVEQVELSVQEAVYTEGVARVSDLDLEQGELED